MYVCMYVYDANEKKLKKIQKTQINKNINMIQQQNQTNPHTHVHNPLIPIPHVHTHTHTHTRNLWSVVSHVAAGNQLAWSNVRSRLGRCPSITSIKRCLTLACVYHRVIVRASDSFTPVRRSTYIHIHITTYTSTYGVCMYPTTTTTTDNSTSFTTTTAAIATTRGSKGKEYKSVCLNHTSIGQGKKGKREYINK